MSFLNIFLEYLNNMKKKINLKSEIFIASTDYYISYQNGQMINKRHMISALFSLVYNNSAKFNTYYCMKKLFHHHIAIFYVSRRYNYISMFCLLIISNPCKIAFSIYFSISCIFVRGPDFRTKVIEILIIKLISVSKENITQFSKIVFKRIANVTGNTSYWFSFYICLKGFV